MSSDDEGEDTLQHSTLYNNGHGYAKQQSFYNDDSDDDDEDYTMLSHKLHKHMRLHYNNEEEEDEGDYYTVHPSQLNNYQASEVDNNSEQQLQLSMNHTAGQAATNAASAANAATAASNGGDTQPFSYFATLAGDLKANLGLLVETGICRVNASASLVAMPTMYDYNSSSSAPLDPLPASAREIYFKQKGGTGSGTQQQQARARTLAGSSGKTATGGDQANDEFFNDNWYFVELHQSILQETTQ